MTDDIEDWYSNESATFGDRIAAAREAQGYSQRDLAKRIGVAVKTVENWENDISEPRANKLQMLSGIVNVSMPWLLTGEGPGLESPEEAAALPEVADVMAEIRMMRADMLRSAERLARLEKRMRGMTVTAIAAE